MRRTWMVLPGLLLILAASVTPGSGNPIPFYYIYCDPADALSGVVLCPADPAPIAASVITVTIQDADHQPVQGLTVEVLFPAGIQLCATAHLTGMTNEQGQVAIALAGGGCIRNTAGACVIRANGVVIRDYQNAKSPDWDGAVANKVVNLSDLVAFAQAYFATAPGCHDYDNNGMTNLGDMVIFGTAWSLHQSCP